MGGARLLLRKLLRISKGASSYSRLPFSCAAFSHGSSQDHQERQFFLHCQQALYARGSDNEQERDPAPGTPKRVSAAVEDGGYVQSLPIKDLATSFLASHCPSSHVGISALSGLSQIRAGGAVGCLLYNGCSPTQGVSIARFLSTSTGHRLEDELGNTSAAGSSAGVFDGAKADVVMTSTTSEAQAVSEVSAVIGDCSYPTAFLQLLLENVHLYAGLPWWGAIVVTTIGIRMLCFPAVLYQQRSLAKLTLMRPEMERINAEIKDSNYDPMVSAAGREQIMALFAKHNTSPFAPFIGSLLQAPVFMCFFFGVRNMAERLESFKDGGTLWFTDLSAADSTFILPILLSASMLLTVELNAAEGMEGNPYGKHMKNFMRLFCVILFPISLNFESALFCYWLTSTYFSLLQAQISKDPRVKEFLNIPATAHLAAPEQPTKELSSPPATRSPAKVKTVSRKKAKSSRRR